MKKNRQIKIKLEKVGGGGRNVDLTAFLTTLLSSDGGGLRV